MKEPEIIINGVELTESQAMTIRLALGIFQMEVNRKNSGRDKKGFKLTKLYNKIINELIVIIHKGI